MTVNPELVHRQSAAMWRAIALRRLHSYRAARETAKLHGDNLEGLIDPPIYKDISAAHKNLLTNGSPSPSIRQWQPAPP